MTRLNVKGLNADKTNYQTLTELREIVKDYNIRHAIVFYDTFIGSHEARKNYPENFSNAKHTTGSIFEADYISRQREKTLGKLENENANIVLLKLKRKAGLLHLKRPDYTHGLYGQLSQVNNKFIEKIGGKLEESLTAHERVIKQPLEERKIRNFFYSEADCMSGILFTESDNLEREVWE